MPPPPNVTTAHSHPHKIVATNNKACQATPSLPATRWLRTCPPVGGVVLEAQFLGRLGQVLPHGDDVHEAGVDELLGVVLHNGVGASRGDELDCSAPWRCN